MILNSVSLETEPKYFVKYAYIYSLYRSSKTMMKSHFSRTLGGFPGKYFLVNYLNRYQRGFFCDLRILTRLYLLKELIITIRK